MDGGPALPLPIAVCGLRRPVVPTTLFEELSDVVRELVEAVLDVLEDIDDAKDARLRGPACATVATCELSDREVGGAA
jgi:hypothetical protein